MLPVDLGVIVALLRATAGAGSRTPIAKGGRRHIVQSDELLTAFHQLEAMFFDETIPGSSYANIWAAGIESASSNAQQDAVSTASRTHNIWQLQTSTKPRPNPT